MLRFRFATVMGLMLALAEVRAQTQFGVKAGVNMSRMASGSSYSAYLFGPHAGIYFRGTDPLTAQVEMLYSSQGGSFPDLTAGQTAERRLHYLNTMLMLRYVPFEPIALVGGLQRGVLINAAEGRVNISDQYDPMDLGLHIGVDHDMSEGLSASLRFCQSLRNIGNQVAQASIAIRIQQLD